jgi:hypothetical protein
MQSAWPPLGLLGELLLGLIASLAVAFGLRYLHRKQHERHWQDANEARRRADDAQAEMEALADRLRAWRGAAHGSLDGSFSGRRDCRLLIATD